MRILISSDLAIPHIGGVELYILNLATRLVELGHEVHWMTSWIHGTKRYEILKGIHIHRVPILLKNRLAFPGRQTYSITSILPGIKLVKRMEVFHANTLVPGPFSWIIAKYARKPSILFCHELFGDLWKEIGQDWLEKRLYPFIERFMAKAPYDRFICPSNYSKRKLIECGAAEDKIVVIPHGIDFSKFNNKRDRINYRKIFGLTKYKLFGYIGRLRIRKTTQSKNLIGLLKAVPHVVKSVPEARLVLCGMGFEELKPIIKKLEIEKYVIYVGEEYSKDFEFNPHFLKMCDVIVCPAFSDGFCFMLAEASACGRPVVATNAGAHPDRVKNNGILTKTTPEDIAEGIVRVLTSKKLASKFSKNSSIYARQFTWEKSVRQHLRVYEELMPK